jgi:hypothetical protein
MLKTPPVSIRLFWQARLSEQQLQPVLVQVLLPWAQEQLLQGPALLQARPSAQQLQPEPVLVQVLRPQVWEQLQQEPVSPRVRLSRPEQRRALPAPSFLQTTAAGDTPGRIPEARL